jgi:maltose-binding protein MalE
LKNPNNKSKSNYECVYGLGECPVLAVLEEKMAEMEQRTKIIPAEPSMAAMNRMVQPIVQMIASVSNQLPAFCPNCPKRIIEIEKRLLELRSKTH